MTSLAELNTNGSARLVIRLMEREDIEDLRVFHNHDDVLLKLTDPAHISQPQQEAWFAAASTSKSSRRYVARLREGNRMVGVFRLDSIDHVNGNAFVGCDIAPDYQGQGFATEFFTYVLTYLFDSCRMHRVELVTLETNTRAIKLYKKLGFIQEGVRRDAIYREGAYQNLLAMGMLDHEWRAAKVRS